MAKRQPTKNKPEFIYKEFKDSVDFLVSNGFMTNDDKLPKIMLKSYVDVKRSNYDSFRSRNI